MNFFGTMVMTEAHSEQELGNKIADLEMANSMLTDFAAVVCHDIRGTLRHVIRYAELLNVVPALNANLQVADCLRKITASIRKIRALADGALASPPQLAASTTPVQKTENIIGSVQQQSRELQRMNCELLDFADSVARCLRTPLDEIQAGAGFLSTLSPVATNPVFLDLTQKILAGTREMQRLVEDYFSFANAERQNVRRKRISLESLAQLVRHELEPMAEGRKVDWQVGPLPEVEANASMLRQVLVNLLSNSLKYTCKRDEAVIQIGERPDGYEHVIFIRDNGVGFDMESAQKLFRKFGRLHNNGFFPGVGIGLVIVKYIIERHGGRVWAEALPQGGATFYFTLPVTR